MTLTWLEKNKWKLFVLCVDDQKPSHQMVLLSGGDKKANRGECAIFWCVSEGITVNTTAGSSVNCLQNEEKQRDTLWYLVLQLCWRGARSHHEPFGWFQSSLSLVENWKLEAQTLPVSVRHKNITWFHTLCTCVGTRHHLADTWSCCCCCCVCVPPNRRALVLLRVDKKHWGSAVRDNTGKTGRCNERLQKFSLTWRRVENVVTS